MAVEHHFTLEDGWEMLNLLDAADNDVLPTS
jgi:hypothetical protein